MISRRRTQDGQGAKAMAATETVSIPQSRSSEPVKRPRNAAATRSDILEAARRAFTRYGYDGIGLRDIAGMVGINAALVNRYFGTKEALFEEAVASQFSVEGWLDEGKRGLGERLATYLLTHKTEADEFDATLAMLRSAANERASGLMRESLETHFVKPLARWLGGADSYERANLIVAALAGLAVMRDVIALPGLNARPEALIRRQARILQELVDG